MHTIAANSPVGEMTSPMCHDNVSVAANTKIDTTNITTAAVKQPAALDKGAVRKAFKSATRAEQRLVLIRELLKLKVGLREVEEYYKGQSETNKIGKNKIRKVELIMKNMVDKCRDAEAEVERALKRKAQMRKTIEKIMGKNTSKTKTMVKRMKNEMMILRKKIQEKNREKIDHLKKTYLKNDTGDKLAKNISRFKSAKVFNNMKLPESEKELPVVVGDVNLDSEELEVLGLPPKFAMFEKLSEEDFEVDTEICFSKYRWDKHQDEGTNNENDDEETKVTEDEQELMDQWEAASRQTYDPVTNVFDHRNKRATDVKHNTRVYLPKALDTKLEAGIEVRRQKYLEVHREYAKEFCDEKNNQQSNLTQSQKQGLRKLRKRIKDGEIVVCLTDKSGKMAVMTMEMYQKAGAVHTDKDEEVDMEYVRQT